MHIKTHPDGANLGLKLTHHQHESIHKRDIGSPMTRRICLCSFQLWPVEYGTAMKGDTVGEDSEHGQNTAKWRPTRGVEHLDDSRNTTS